MSTRSTISVLDDRDTFNIYRHHDGYPQGEHGVVHDLRRATDFAWDTPRFQAADFSAAVVRAMKRSGGSVYLTSDADHHGDRDYHYDIRHADREIQLAIWDFTRRAEEATRIFDGSLSDAVTEFESGPAESERDTTLARVWEALGAAEAAMADPEVAQRKGIWRDAARLVYAAMDDHRAEKRAASPMPPED